MTKPPARGPRLPLETGRLRIREFGAGDEDALVGLYSDRRVTRHLLYGPSDAESTREHLAGILKRQHARRRDSWELAAERCDDGLLVGAADLVLHSSAEAELGYCIAHACWGQGYATEIAAALLRSAFEGLRVQRVVSTVEIGNSRSVSVLEKAGLRWEGTFRRYARARRRWWDVYLYAVGREDWLQARA